MSMSYSPEDIVRGSVRLSSLPEIYFKINKVIDDPESSFGDVAKIISNDVSLSARLLKIVNSTFYNFPSKVDTISHAISIVGTQQLRDLALATMVLSSFKGIPETHVNMKSFWRHSVACGVSAWVIALNCHEENPERYYLTGMLHDVGRLIIFENHPEISGKIMEQSRAEKKLVFEVERDVLGFDHGAVGAELMMAWKLPPTLGDVVRNHHNPAENSRFPLETAILHLADIFAKSMELGSSGDPLTPPVLPESWDRIGMDVNSLSMLWGQIENQFEETMDIFSMD
ncbi:Predicted signal transduction protein [hydrothermal vent metagenome]|uniref:Predicted signal transduction protein n=1 Tax=hydrothermal vent metagenome TaxID=652676 RepID=A0A3B1CZL4_9ZZZZ